MEESTPKRPGRKPGSGRGLTKGFLVTMTPELHGRLIGAAGKRGAAEWARVAIEQRLEREGHPPPPPTQHDLLMQARALIERAAEMAPKTKRRK